ncbi:hypothetical protein RQP46_009674 [Phenoliferia psychrophenolica]
MLDPALKNEAAILHSYVKEGKLVEEGLLIDPRTTSYDDAIALVTKHKPWGIPPGSSFNFKIKHTTPAGDHSVYLCVTPGVWGRHECMYLDVILPSTTVDQPSNEQETPAVIVLAPEAAPPTPASERPTSPAPGPSRRRSSTTPVREEEESSATPEDEEEEIEIVPQTPDSSDTEEMVATTGRFNALEKGKGRAQSRTSSRETLAALADGPLDEAARVASSSQSSTSANGPLPLSQQQPLFLPPLTSSLGSSTHSHRKATSPSPRDSAPSPQPPAGKGPSPSETSAFNTSRLASETPSWHSSKAPRRRSMNPTGSNNAQRDKEKRDKLKNAPRPDPPLLARSPRWHLYLRLPNEDQGPNNRGMQGLFRERHNWCEIRPIALGGKTGDCTIWTIFQVAARETGWDVTQFKLRTLMETSDGKRTLEFDGRVPEHRDAAKGTTLENWGLATSGGLIDLDCFE